MDSLKILFMHGIPTFEGSSRMQFIKYAVEAAQNNLSFDRAYFLEKGVPEKDVNTFESKFYLIMETYRYVKRMSRVE